MKEVEIYLDILKRLDYYIMRDESLNDCEILSNKDGKISYFKLYNSSISKSGMWMYVDIKYAKIKSEGITKIGDKRYYTINFMNKEQFDKYYKEMFRKYKLINILDV